MGLVFYKMTGSGNDFVVLDGRHTAAADWPPDRVAAVCDRRLGVGADGLVIVTPAVPPPPAPPDRIRMEYFNSDGSPAPMCGNAALCSTRLAAYLELACPDGMILLTGAGEMRTRCRGPLHLSELLLPPFPAPHEVHIDPQPGERAFFLGTVGVPHLVVLTEQVGAVDLPRRGRELRSHPAAGPEGANVNFVSPPPDGGAAWLIRTYERGVEAETLACGTGTVAAAFALDAAGVAPLPRDWRTPLGIRLSVAGARRGAEVDEAWLCGEGRLVFTGILR